MNIVLTCEHASNALPDFLNNKIPQKTLDSHRGFDRGALNLAQHLSQHFNLPLFVGQYSRLAIDLNRSIGHPKVSIFPEAVKNRLIQAVHNPFREQVLAELKKHPYVLHLSVHSFTRVLHKVRRNADIGILYDPKRKQEAEFAKIWQKSMFSLRVRRNYPYSGASDGHTTALRKLFPKNYLGIELEVCDDRLAPAVFDATAAIVSSSLEKALSLWKS